MDDPIHSFVSLIFDKKGLSVIELNKHEKKISEKQFALGICFLKLTFDMFGYVSDYLRTLIIWEALFFWVLDIHAIVYYF